MTQEDQFRTPDQMAHEHEKQHQAEVTQEALNFVNQFPIPESHTTPHGVVLNREEIIAETQKSWELLLELGDTPQSKVAYIREQALYYGVGHPGPVNQHLPTVLEAYSRNEAQLPAEKRALTLAVKLEILSVALGAEISLLTDRIADCLNPLLRNKALYRYQDSSENTFGVDSYGEPVLKTIKTRENAGKTDVEHIPGSETIQNIQELAALGYPITHEYVTSGYQDLQFDVARLVLITGLKNQAEWLRVELLKFGN